jgi:predicted DNA-binding transcriptional regulator AlpA
MEQEIFRVNDFCIRFAISRSEFYRQINANRLQVMKRGRRTYVTRSDAMAWIASQQREGSKTDEHYSTNGA